MNQTTQTNKIQRLSRILRILFQIVLVLQPIFLLLFWTTLPHRIGSNGFFIKILPYGIHVMHNLPLGTRLLALFVSMIPTAITMAILFFLIKLFRAYERGDIFTYDNVRAIRNTGIFLLVSQIIAPIFDIVISVILTINNPPGHRKAIATFNSQNFTVIIIAVIIILASWIMLEAYKMRDEQQYIV